MSKKRFPRVLALAGILVLAWARWHAAGLAVALAGLAAVYWSSVRLHPRTRHARCNGTGEHHSPLFPWTHRRCGRCSSGRIIRWGAGQFGAPPVQAERTRTRAANRAARQAHRWR